MVVIAYIRISIRLVPLFLTSILFIILLLAITMAMYSSTTEQKRSFFRPQLSATYAGKEGKFSVYDLETKETTETNEIEMIYITGDVYTIEQVGVYKSNYISNPYSGQKIILKNVSNWSTYGTYQWNKEAKEFLDDKWNAIPDQVKPFRHLVGINKDGKVISLSLWGSVMWDLKIKNKEKTNVEKIKTMEESNFITLTPAKELTKVYATTKVHLLEVVGAVDELDADTQLIAEQVNEQIESDIKYHQDKDFVPSTDTLTAEDIPDVFSGAETVEASDIPDGSIEDKPF